MTNETARTSLLELRKVADCDQIATLLGLGGKEGHFCPDCRARGRETPAMKTEGDRWSCGECQKSGDVVDLVRKTLSCEEISALDFIKGALGMGKLSEPADARVSAGATGREAPRLAAPAEAPSPTRRVKIYSAFLEACRFPVGAALEFLTARGVSPSAAEAAGVRFCGAEYEQRIEELAKFFKRSALKATGLLQFAPYVQKVGGFLVFPYASQGVPVLLRARAPVDPDHLRRLELPQTISSGRRLPCLFNQEALRESRDVLLCRGELDTLVALSHGRTAVGVPGWAYFKTRWAGAFKGKKVSVLVAANQATDPDLQGMLQKMTAVGIRALSLLTVPDGVGLDSFFLQQPAP